MICAAISHLPAITSASASNSGGGSARAAGATHFVVRYRVIEPQDRHQHRLTPLYRNPRQMCEAF